jgi:predicted nucleotidyltransferase
MSVPHLNEQEKRSLAELKVALVVLLGDRLLRFALFGSKARGDESPESDLDVAIVVKGLERGLKRKILDIVTDIELRNSVVLSTFIVSAADFEHLRTRERRIALDIEKESVPL